jgi:hypothetical protein
MLEAVVWDDEARDFPELLSPTDEVYAVHYNSKWNLYYLLTSDLINDHDFTVLINSTS